MTKKSWIALGAAVVVALWAWSSFNGLATSDQAVKNSYAQVQNVMQRQADLIPNLVETAKGYAGHENKTLIGVTEARSKLSAAAKLDPTKIANDPALQEQVFKAQQSMQASMIELNAVREAYPQLQANENFKLLMTELAGSQNRITVERMRSQKATQDFNNRVVTFPTRLIAGAVGFPEKPYFQASETAQSAPQVKF
jgi:LemA protein